MTVQLTEAETWVAARDALSRAALVVPAAPLSATLAPEPIVSVVPRGYGSWSEYMASLPKRARRGETRAVPAPEPIVLIGATSPRNDQVPAGARRLCEYARRSGWRVRATYALAEVPAHVRVTAEGVSRAVDAELVETLAVRLQAPDGRAGYALWRNGGFHRAYFGGARYAARALVELVKLTPAEGAR